MAVRITKYEQAFDLICVKFDEKARNVIKNLENEGHTEKSICFSVWKGQENLYKYRRDERFWGIFIKTVRKWSWPKGDPRWDDYWKRKNEEKRAKEAAEQAEKLMREKMAQEQAYKKRYPGFVYFIQGESGGPIKIGYTIKVGERLKSLQTGYPDLLKVLLAIPGSQNDEAEMHNEFTIYRLHGEWFKPAQEIFEKIKQLESQYYPQWKAVE